MKKYELMELLAPLPNDMEIVCCVEDLESGYNYFSSDVYLCVSDSWNDYVEVDNACVIYAKDDGKKCKDDN